MFEGNLFFNITGLIGVGLILVAYFLLQVGKLEQRDERYSWLNLIGALMIVVSLLKNWNLPSFVIEIFWIAISIYGLTRARRLKNKSKS